MATLSAGMPKEVFYMCSTEGYSMKDDAIDTKAVTLHLSMFETCDDEDFSITVSKAVIDTLHTFFFYDGALYISWVGNEKPELVKISDMDEGHFDTLMDNYYYHEASSEISDN